MNSFKRCQDLFLLKEISYYSIIIIITLLFFIMWFLRTTFIQDTKAFMYYNITHKRAVTLINKYMLRSNKILILEKHFKILKTTKKNSRLRNKTDLVVTIKKYYYIP